MLLFRSSTTYRYFMSSISLTPVATGAQNLLPEEEAGTSSPLQSNSPDFSAEGPYAHVGVVRVSSQLSVSLPQPDAAASRNPQLAPGGSGTAASGRMGALPESGRQLGGGGTVTFDLSVSVVLPNMSSRTRGGASGGTSGAIRPLPLILMLNGFQVGLYQRAHTPPFPPVRCASGCGLYSHPKVADS